MASESPSPSSSPNAVRPVSSVNPSAPPPRSSPSPLPSALPPSQPPSLPPSSPASPPASPPILPTSPPLPPATAPSPTTSPPPPAAVPPSPPPNHSPPLPPPTSAATPPPHPRVPPKSPPPSPSPSPPTNNDSSKWAPPLPAIPKEKPIARANLTVSNANSTSSGGLRAESVAVVGSFVGFLSLSLVIIVIWFSNRRKKIIKDDTNVNHVHVTPPSPPASFRNTGSTFLTPQYSAQLSGNGSMSNLTSSTDGGGMGNTRSWFTYEELSVATNGFSENVLLGQGGFGSVYKGVLIDGREVAVKQLKAGGGQGEREFRSEVEIISRIHHKHLVSLVGYCIFETQRLLVYEYVPNNTLHCHLHGKTGRLSCE